MLHLFKDNNLAGRLARWFATIDESDPTKQYLLGKPSVGADALSRNVAVASVLEITNFSCKELFTAQRQEPLWSAVVYALESDDEFALPKLHVPLS